MNKIFKIIMSITDALRENLDLEEVLGKICTEIMKLFNADIVVIAGYPKGQDRSRWEFLANSSLITKKSEITSETFSQDVKKFLADYLLVKKQKMIINDLANSNLPEDVKKAHLNVGIKSILAVPIYKDEDKCGILGIFSTQEKRKWSDKDIEILDLIVNQIYIAIRQAKLNSTIKQQADRELLLRSIIEKIRNSLDLNELLIFICNEIAKLFNVQRASILEFPEPDNYSKYLIHGEYKDSPDIKGLTDISNYEKIAMYWGCKLFKSGTILNIDDLPDSDLPDYFKEFYNTLGVKSIIGSPIKKGEDIWGSIILSEYNYNRHWTFEDRQLLSAVSNQIYIAIKQLELYKREKQIAEREKLLREIVSIIKVSNNLDNAYNCILGKLSDIFNIYRAIFIEIPSYKFEKSYVKYEYLKNDKYSSLKNIKIPDTAFNALKNETKNSEPLIIDNVKNFCIDDEETQEFFENYSIKSFMAISFIKHNHGSRICGYFMLCSSELRQWNQEEITLLKLIKDSIINIIWEITKLIEINELRNTFTITLAHDIQVPLVGQQKALEYLASRKSDDPISKYMPFINEIIESNKDLTALLMRVLDSYYYESGTKKLDLSKRSILPVINEVIDSFRNLAESKSISLNFETEELPETCIDKNEIKKAIYNILENALIYTQINGYVVVSCFKLENSISICISDNGPGLSDEVKERLFERYAMAQVIERKIGSGLGLYLSKQIIEAHKGSIFYTTEIGAGSTFCILLPIPD